MCALELVAWLAGERHSDSPDCTSPVITALVRSFNDVIPSDAARSYYLRSSIPRLINTRASRQVEKRRAATVIDFLVRGLLPMLLHKQGRHAEASELAGLKPIETQTGIVLAGLAARQECDNRQVAWAARMASRDLVPSLWVPVAAKMIEEIGTPLAYESGVALINRLIKVGQPVTRSTRGRRTAPPTA